MGCDESVHSRLLLNSSPFPIFSCQFHCFENNVHNPNLTMVLYRFTIPSSTYSLICTAKIRELPREREHEDVLAVPISEIFTSICVYIWCVIEGSSDFKKEICLIRAFIKHLTGVHTVMQDPRNKKGVPNHFRRRRSVLFRREHTVVTGTVHRVSLRDLATGSGRKASSRGTVTPFQTKAPTSINISHRLHQP